MCYSLSSSVMSLQWLQILECFINLINVVFQLIPLVFWECNTCTANNRYVTMTVKMLLKVNEREQCTTRGLSQKLPTEQVSKHFYLLSGDFNLCPCLWKFSPWLWPWDSVFIYAINKMQSIFAARRTVHFLEMQISTNCARQR